MHHDYNFRINLSNRVCRSDSHLLEQSGDVCKSSVHMLLTTRELTGLANSENCRNTVAEWQLLKLILLSFGCDVLSGESKCVCTENTCWSVDQ